MRINPIMCAPGYLMSGGPVAFKHQPVIKAARVQWQRLGRTVDAVSVLNPITDFPGGLSALSSVRRT